MLNTLAEEKIAGIPILYLAIAAIALVIIIIIAVATKGSAKKKKNKDSSYTTVIPQNPAEKGEKKKFDISQLNLHEDFKDLILTWDNIKIFHGLNSDSDLGIDPSLVDEYLPVNINATKKDTPPPRGVYSFAKMTPNQRGRYLNFLCDPYNGDFEQGYAILLLYNMERHIIFDNSGIAADVISKLRKEQKGKLFTELSFAALTYFANRNYRFLEFLYEEYDNISYDEILYYHINTDKMLPCLSIVNNISLYRVFADKNIPTNKLIMTNALEAIMMEKYGSTGYPLTKYTPSNTPKLSNQPFPANPSFDKRVNRYITNKHIYEVEPMRTEIENLLEEMYINVVT